MVRWNVRTAAILAAAVAGTAASNSRAALTFTVEANGWPNAAHRDAAIAAAQSSVNRYNTYGDFGNYNIYIYYNAGIPTAQANYLGSVGFGGTYPNERVMMHEMAHYLGSGTYGDPWDGANGEARVDQFDGLEASLNGDSAHFWPYGLNYDSEGSEINKQRQVALLFAQRADMGIGPVTPSAWAATSVTLTASDSVGESGFNYASKWSDNTFAHPNAAYSTGNFVLRTPASGNSFTFVGSSLTVNNTNGIDGGLLYKGSGSTGVTRFNLLVLNGGYVRHASNAGDLFQLAGTTALQGHSTIDAAQGDIKITSFVGGSGSLTVKGAYSTTLTGNNTYIGGTNVTAGTLRVASNSALGTGSVVLNGGTLSSDSNSGTVPQPTITNAINIAGGSRIAGGAGTLFRVNGNITGSAPLGLSGVFNSAGLRLAGNNSGYTGTATVTGANTRLGSTAASSAAATWVVNGNLQTDVAGGGSFQLGALSGTGAISGHAINASPAVSTLVVGALNTSTTFSGSITNNAANDATTGNAEGAANNVLALTKVGTGALTLSGINGYSGPTTINGGTLRLAYASSNAIAKYTFDNVSGNTVINDGAGGAPMNGALANGASIVAGGQSGNAVSFSSGSSVSINNAITDLGSSGNWTVSAWVKTSTPGATILSKSAGGWAYGNTVFYLGDGTGPGSGGVPSAVRWAGGFFQAAGGSTPVNDGTWRMVTYVNNGGTYAIYTDGVPQTLSSGNSSFSVPDVGSIVRLGFTTNTIPADGTVHFVGLMDNVQIYNQSLSAAQITALYQGINVAPLPSTTAVTIAGGATLDVNGITQQIGSLSGSPGSAVTLGSGQLIVNSAATTTFAGAISGSGGSMVKSGGGALTLSGVASYTGNTTVAAGTLVLGPSAHSPVLTGGGAILNGGTLVLDYTGGSSPQSMIVADLINHSTTGFQAGKVRTSLAPDSTKAIGWLDDGTSIFQARYTHKGDIDLSGVVDSQDFNAFVAGYGLTSKAIWGAGDTNYDGDVNTIDFNHLAGNFGLPAIAALPGDLPALGATVPEPASLGVLGLGVAATLGRRRRQS